MKRALDSVARHNAAVAVAVPTVPSVVDVGVAAKRHKRSKKKPKKGALAEAAPAAMPQEPAAAAAAPATHAFDVDEDDHAETPVLAYEHVAPFLNELAFKLGKTRDQLVIYDPYFCAGGVKDRLASLGFTNVINRNADCYSEWATLQHDVVVTNPPYSGDHLERMCRQLAAAHRPFAFVVPNFVVKKPYHRELLEPLRPFFLVPTARYVYEPPRGMRSKKKSDTQKKTAPFVSLWHCYGGPRHHEALCRWAANRNWGEGLRVARSRNALRDLRRK